MKRATFLTIRDCTSLYFNPRPREEGDHISSGTRSHISYFNPRPREEGDRIAMRIFLYSEYFNPRPREEGDFCRISCLPTGRTISIHALVKRATSDYTITFNFDAISIHALVKRATEGIFLLSPPLRISIHALVKRATRFQYYYKD